MQKTQGRLKRAEEANPDGWVVDLRSQISMDRRVLAVPEVSPVLAHEEALFGESRHAELPGEFKVMLEVDGILDVPIV